MQWGFAHDTRKDYQNTMRCYNYCITHTRNESFLVTVLLNIKKALHLYSKVEHILHTLNKTKTLIDADIILRKLKFLIKWETSIIPFQTLK